MVSELHWLDLTELRRKIVRGEVSALEATERALERAASLGPGLNAFVTLDADAARRAAQGADRALASGRAPGALHGVPVTVKDLIETRGLPTSAGSRAELGLSDRRDAPVVRRLRRAGAVVLGKTNLNELAYGVTGENAHFGQVPTPWDRGRMAGGSSSGSGATLAVGIGYASLGTDTRGSIRIPAACCGVSGLKPTRGLLPLEGVSPLSWTLDHVGPMARSAEDLAALMAVLVGGRRARERFGAARERPLRGLRLGVPHFYLQDLDPAVHAAVEEALTLLVSEGMKRVDIDLPQLRPCLAASAVIAASEGLAVHHQRLRAGAEGYGAPVLARLEAAYAFTGLDLAQAQATRRELLDAYRKAFRSVDVMAGPTLPGPPAPIGSPVMPLGAAGEEAIVNASCRLVAPQNMTGVPAASVPCGFTEGGLPVGLQVWAAAGADDLVLAVAHRYQQRTEWHRKRPEERGAPARTRSNVPEAEVQADAAPA